MQEQEKPFRFSETPVEEAPVAPEPPKQKPMSFGGFAENALRDAFEQLKGIYQLIPTVAGEAVKIFKARKDLPNVKMEDVLGGVEDNVLAMKDAIIEPYKKYGARVLYEKPVTAATDLLAIYGLTAKSAGMAGRMAGGVVKAKPLTMADKVVTMAKYIEDLPSNLARKAVDKGVLTATGGKLDLAKRRDFLAIKRHELAYANEQLVNDMAQVGQKVAGLSDEEAAVFHKWRTQGASAAEAATNPKVAEALESYRKLTETWQKEYGARKVLSPEQMREALVKKHALEAFDSVDEASLLKSRAAIEAAEVKPVYGPNIWDKAKKFTPEEFLDDLVTGGKTVREGKVAALETMRGAKGYIKDPRIYVPQAIRAFRQTEAKFRISERLRAPGNEKLIAGAPGAATEGMKAESIPEGVHRKYYEDRIRAESLAKITDPTIKRLLKWEYLHTNHGLIRLYDAILGAFRKSATVMNPKWYVGNAVGDAVLGTLAGADWIKAKKLLDATKKQELLKRGLPPEVVAKMEMGGELGGGGKLEKITDIANSIDQATRAGIVVREVGRQLKEAGINFQASAEVLEEVLSSTRQFSELQVRMTLLQEAIERNNALVAGRAKKIERLKVFEEKLSSKLEAIELKAQLKPYQKIQEHEQAAQAIKGRAAEGAAEKNRITAGYGPDVKPESLPEWQKAEALSKKAEDIRKESILGASGQRGFERGMEKLNQLRQKISNLEAEKAAIVRDITEDVLDRDMKLGKMPQLQQQVQIVRNAVDRANAFIGDYIGLDGFEQGVMRRLVPFYPWAKAMTMLAFRLPFLSPVKGFLWHRYATAMWSMVGDQELPEYMKGYVPVLAREDGSLIWVSLGSYSPFGGVKQTKYGDVPLPNVLAFGEQNPFISLMYQMQGGKTIFQRTQVPAGEPLVNITNGEVVEFGSDGMLRKTIPQTPLVSGLVHMFPITQLIQDVLVPYKVNKYNWIGLPEPTLNPDGSYRYPREWFEMLSALGGVKLKVGTPEQMKRNERFRVKQAVEELKVKYKRAGSQEEREMIRETMRDYLRGEYRKFAG